VFINRTYVRAHQNSTGIKNQDISKSIDGNSSKIHLAVDSHGNPIEFIISTGTTHNVKFAQDLVNKLDLSESIIVCTDKGYDSETSREKIQATRACSHLKNGF